MAMLMIFRLVSDQNTSAKTYLNLCYILLQRIPVNQHKRILNLVVSLFFDQGSSGSAHGIKIGGDGGDPQEVLQRRFVVGDDSDVFAGAEALVLSRFYEVDQV